MAQLDIKEYLLRTKNEMPMIQIRVMDDKTGNVFYKHLEDPEDVIQILNILNKNNT